MPAGVFLAASGVHLVVAWCCTKIQPTLSVRSILAGWDGAWYLKLAQSGYPANLRGGAAGAPPGQSTAGFFPLYSLLVRAVHTALPISWLRGAVLVSVVAGMAFAVVLWQLVRAWCGPEIADRSVALVCFAPSAFVLTMIYSEGLFLLFAAACLLGLYRRWWVFAGLAALLGAATRPNGVVLIACCAVGAALAFWRAHRARDPLPWTSLAAPLLAPLGFVAFVAYDANRFGTPTAYWTAQHRGWQQGFDGGWHTVQKLGDVIGDPLRDFNLLAATIAVVIILIGLVFMWFWRPPAEVWVFVVGVVFLALASTSLTSTNRFVLTAFPLLVAMARKVRGNAFSVLLACSASAMVILTVLAATTRVYTP
ncbi:MAG: hypothetical protein JWL73_3539 [Actinomycetia bacterium]|nr:hypothetical protein [Actinomycetes bacterium]